MTDQEQILSFIEERLGIRKPIPLTSDLFNDHGVYGDDLWDFIEAYAEKFEVSTSNFLWYFHSREEGSFSIGRLFFKPPNERVEHIPITPEMLVEFAEKGVWDLKYPEHSIPPKRLDLTINTIIGGIVILVLILFLIWKGFG